MKYLFVCILWLCGFHAVWSQSIEELERQLPSLQGTTYLSTALQLTDHYLQSEDYTKAEELSNLLLEKAQQEGEKNWQALALNRQGRILMESPQLILNRKINAEKAFRSSINLTTDVNLQRDNLQQLLNIAKQRNRSGDIADIQSEIKLLESDIAQFQLRQEKQALNDSMSDLSARQVALDKKIAEREAALNRLTNQQVRNELQLLEKQWLLDSISYANFRDSIRLKEEEAEVERLENNLRMQKSQRNFYLALFGVALLAAINLLWRFNNSRKTNRLLADKNKEIRAEKQRSETLLLNILPRIVAEELKTNGTAKAQRYEQATVLFTDFKDFTKISTQLSPEQLVSDLDYCFQAFDQIIEKHGLEKIKTIGDSYMCAGGLPAGSTSSAAEVIRAAIDIQAFLATWANERATVNLPIFTARIGIHTGPIVAGVVGKKKFAYDIWGDTVNVASRMETNGEPGKINVSAATYALTKDTFTFTPRGAADIKNYGKVNMYFVENEQG